MAAHKFKNLEVTLLGVQLLVTGTYYPVQRGRDYMPNGDPGYPPEPARVDFDYVEIIGGVDADPLLSSIRIKDEDGYDLLGAQIIQDWSPTVGRFL